MRGGFGLVYMRMNYCLTFFHNSFYNRRDVPTTIPSHSLGLDGCPLHSITAIGSEALEKPTRKNSLGVPEISLSRWRLGNRPPSTAVCPVLGTL